MGGSWDFYSLPAAYLNQNQSNSILIAATFHSDVTVKTIQSPVLFFLKLSLKSLTIHSSSSVHLRHGHIENLYTNLQRPPLKGAEPVLGLESARSP